MAERVAFLASGGGSTAAAMLGAQIEGVIPNCEIGCIVSNKPGAGAFDKARALKFPENRLIPINLRDYLGEDKKINKELFADDLMRLFDHFGVTFFMQLGWLPKTPDRVVDYYQGRAFNQHLAQVPYFAGDGMYGKRALAALLNYQRLTGDSFPVYPISQYVDREYDQGAVVNFTEVPVIPNEKVATLYSRVLPAQHQLQIETAIKLTTGQIREVTLPFSIHPNKFRYLEIAKKQGIRDYPRG